jgi:hypothetical protein
MTMLRHSLSLVSLSLVLVGMAACQDTDLDYAPNLRAAAGPDCHGKKQGNPNDCELMCEVDDCGPPLLMPNLLCEDGVSVAGPTGNCIDIEGQCGWEVLECPAIACGGFAGLVCPDKLVCVDDPSDDCNPDKGGADCMGICVSG